MKKHVSLSSLMMFWRALLYLVIIAGAVTMVAPLIWMVSTSLKTYSQALSWPPRWIPHPLSLESYGTIFSLEGFWRYVFNTAVYAIWGTVAYLFLCTTAGFAFGRYSFPGRDYIFFSVLTTMMIPFYVTFIPVFLLLRDWGWVDTFYGLIIPGLGSAFGVFLVRQFAKSVPTELIEAARIDGCSEFRVYWQIFLPLSKPVMATLAIISFLDRWNDLFWPLIITNIESMRTLQLALTYVGRSMYDIWWNYVMAGAALASIPVLVLFAFLQRNLVQGISLTGIKQ